MCFVNDPVAHFPLLQDRPHREVSELLRRDQQHRGIAEADTVERIMALRQGQEPVDGNAGGDALPLQVGDLISHERDERRDDDREGADPVITSQRR